MYVAGQSVAKAQHELPNHRNENVLSTAQRTSTWNSGKAISHLGVCRDRHSRSKWGASSLAHAPNMFVLDCQPKPTPEAE